MKAYEETLQFILDNGTWVKNERTGKNCLTFPVRHMLFDLTEGFPAVSSKKLAWKAVVGELLGFLRGAQSAQTFRDLGCKIWDQNANDPGNPEAPNQWLANPFRKGEDDLGRIYGAQWRNWNAFKMLELGPDKTTDDQLIAVAKAGYDFDAAVEFDDEGNGKVRSALLFHKKVDQMGEIIQKLICNPSDRRILMHAWNPAELDEMALVPCHLYYQFIPNPVTKELSLHMTQRSH